MADLLRWKEIADRLGVPPSTSRYWRDQYIEYLPHVGEGAQRRYRPECAEVLAFVRDCMAASMPSEDVAQALAERYARTIEQPRTTTEPQQGAAILADTIGTAVERAMDRHAAAEAAQIEALQAQVEELLRRVREPEARRARLVARVRAMLGRRGNKP